MSDDEVLAEQIAYYEARAREYDRTSTPEGDPHAADGEATRAALRSFAPRGRVLEIACGTGQWTAVLAEYADELVALDASPQMLAANAARVGDPRVRYLETDVFAYVPDTPFDVIFFGFWLSHVPMSRFERFWELVAGCLAPGGRVFFVDEGRHGAWDEDWIDRDAGIVRRTLTDGSEHRAVKVLWQPEDLERRLRALGWAIEVRSAGLFYWGAGQRSTWRATSAGSSR